LNTTVRLLIGLPDDLTLILDYLCEEHFGGDLGKFSNFKNTTANILELFEKAINKQRLKQSLKNSQVILATDCFELCGLISSSSEEFIQNANKTLCVDLFEVCKGYG
jgi:hypothetical protein